MTTPDIEPAYTLDQGSGAARLRGRFNAAWSKGGIAGLGQQLRQVALWRLHLWLLDPVLEGREGAEIAETTGLESLTIDSANRSRGVWYTPTPILVARRVRDLVPGPHGEWNFIDIGAGRGRVVAQAARRPFRRVTGVEFAAELAQDAKRHVASTDLGKTPAAHVEILQADATCFDIPDGPSLYFLFNPFAADVLRAFIDHIKADALARAAPVRVVYYHPDFAELFEDDEAFRPVRLPMATRAFFALSSPFDVRVFDLG